MDIMKRLGKSADSFNNAGEGERIVKIPLGKIMPSRFQPRLVFDKGSLDELANSIREKGVLEPIIVRPSSDPDFQFELVAGERRLRASKLAGLETIPSIIRELNDNDACVDALVENIQRENLTIVEQIEGMAKLLEVKNGDTAAVSSETGKALRTVQRYIGIHRDISPYGELHEIVKSQADSIDLKTIERFAKVAKKIAGLKQSNNREYIRMLKAMRKSGILKRIDKLEAKFGRKPRGKNTPSTQKIFTEDEKAIAIKIRIKKDGGISPEYREHVTSEINAFLDKLSAIPDISEG